MTSECIKLTPKAVLDNWVEIYPKLAVALAHGEEETPLEIHIQRVLGGHSEIWAFLVEGKLKGVGLTQVLRYHTHTTFHIVAVGGVDWDEWQHHYASVREYAKSLGCKSIEQWGRKGWEKKLRDKIPSMRVAYTVMRDDL
jgi:hypothetical protein